MNDNEKKRFVDSLLFYLGNDSTSILNSNISKLKEDLDTPVIPSYGRTIWQDKLVQESSSEYSREMDTEQPEKVETLSSSESEEEIRQNQKGCVSEQAITKIVSIVLIVVLIVAGLIIGGAIAISSFFEFNIWVSLLIIICSLILIILILLGLRAISNYVYEKLEERFNYIKNESIVTLEESELPEQPSDEIYNIITNTYKSLSNLGKERERQARSSYNIAVTLIIAGVCIVFFGVFLLYQRSLAEGSITSAIGAISNILGGTIMKFYNNANNRLDRLNRDLFILNTSKVQYALLSKIDDMSLRDNELTKLIVSIGNISKKGANESQ